MRTTILFFLILAASTGWAQSRFSGQVTDLANQPVFAANVYFKQHPQQGTTTDLDGHFTLKISSDLQADTLVCSFIGYQTSVLPIQEIQYPTNIQIQLKEQSLNINTITVSGKSPISEQFAVQQLKPLDIYLNPVSNADPLKAITFMAASTNTNESANPNLRGSPADRSLVVLNGVPVQNPVRNSQINGTGFFSLFNTEVISNIQVYPGNPPLTYGNSSAGLVEVQLRDEVPENSLQLSAGLASAGVLTQQKIGNNHFRLYGNYQFSKPFIELNQPNLPDLKKFDNKDIGLSWYRAFSDQLEVHLFSYGIDEAVRAHGHSFGYSDLAKAQKTRNFNILTVQYQNNNQQWSLRHGSNFSNSQYQFGNLSSNARRQQWYHSLNFKEFTNTKWTWQTGINHDFQQAGFQDTIPRYFFAFAENAPTLALDTTIRLHQLEAYAYASWEPSSDWVISAGLRSNVPIAEQESYLSFQLSARYRLDRQQSFLLGLGQYHNYRRPAFVGQHFELLRSRQISLDYDLQWDEGQLQAAIFAKQEQGNQEIERYLQVLESQILGTEISLQQDIGKYWRAEASNIVIRQRIRTADGWQRGDQTLHYFVKAALQWNRPRYLSASMVYMTRPGTYFTEVTEAIYQPESRSFAPVFSTDINGAQFGAYHRLDLSLSRVILLSGNIKSIIVYASVNNILNQNNQQVRRYNPDFSDFDYGYFQKRTIYFGTVFNW